jgi:Tol biopolymer transport system component
VWKVDLSRGINSQLTVEALSMNARWSRDGQYVFFDSARGGAAGIYRKRADGTGPEELIWKTEGALSDVAGDGRLLVHEGQTCTTVPTAGASKASPFLAGASLNACGRFNGDGRFVAYTLGESGRSELYVAPFPQGSPRLQVSRGGGREPRWRKDGKELFYVAPDGRIMSVAMTLTPTLAAAPPRELFSAITLTSGPFAEYSVAPDAQHFLMILPFEDPRSESFTIITHWSSTVRR